MTLGVKRITRNKITGKDGKELATGITIELADGTAATVDCRTLRTNCPCATCTEERAKAESHSSQPAKRSLLRVVSSETNEQLGLEKIWPVGNYALGMRWADGHDTGIYPIATLFELSRQSSTTTS